MKSLTWWGWVALTVGTAASIGLNVVVTTNLAQRSVRIEQAAERKAERVEQAARLQASEDSRKVTCEVVNAQIQVFRETAPATAAGRNAARAWLELGARFNCQGGK